MPQTRVNWSASGLVRDTYSRPWLGDPSPAKPAAAQQQGEGCGVQQQLQQLQDREHGGAEPQAPEAAHGRKQLRHLWTAADSEHARPLRAGPCRGGAPACLARGLPLLASAPGRLTE